MYEAIVLIMREEWTVCLPTIYKGAAAFLFYLFQKRIHDIM